MYSPAKSGNPTSPNESLLSASDAWFPSRLRPVGIRLRMSEQESGHETSNFEPCPIGDSPIAFLAASTSLLAQQTPETVHLAGLKQPVDILVDHWGVPHIYASNEADLFFAQGFNVARDRLFQVDLWRRRGLGELAEVFGPGFIEQDKAARLFLYRGDMQREWAAYSPDAQSIVTNLPPGQRLHPLACGPSTADAIRIQTIEIPAGFMVAGRRGAHTKSRVGRKSF